MEGVEQKLTTVEGVLDKLQQGLSARGLLILTLLLFAHPCTLYVVYYPNIGGYIPYSQWNCTSKECRDRITEFKSVNPDKSPINSDVLCGRFGDNNTELVAGVDFVWEMAEGRSTYAVDWDIYCSREYKGALLSSLYFVGGFFGLLIGSVTFDTLGRRTTLMLGYSTVGVCMLVTAGSPNIGFMMAVRILMGVGSYAGLSGLYVYIIENTSARWRAMVSSYIAVMWGLGSLIILPALGYLVHNWRWLAAAGGIQMLVAAACWLLVPNSPRQLMENKGDKKAALVSLQHLARLLGKELRLEEIDLKSSEKEGVTAPSYLDTLKDFIHFRELRIQLLIQMFQWMVIAFLYYGFVFSWSKLGKNIYWSYVFSGVAEIAASLLCWFGQEVLGRRLTIISFYAVGGASFLLALVPLSFGSDVLTLEQLMCLIGSMFVSGTWGTLYLYVAEQSPTTHRGKMSAICSIAARIGSFAGPQASLMFTWNKTATLVFFAVLAISAGLLAFRLPETKGRTSPNTAQEVEDRKREEKF